MGKVFYLSFTGGSIMVSIYDVASYLLSKRPNMSHKKLQKLCYYVQAWHLAVFKERLINCEFEAWVHGPVCKELYNAYRSSSPRLFEGNNLNPTQKHFVDLVFDIYGKRSGDELELLSHSEDPWKDAREGLHYWELSNKPISDAAMISYYENELRCRG